MKSTDNITALILCGGLGTRLKSVSGDLPKPMVLVAGRPFLEYVLDYLILQGVTKAVLAVSYQNEIIIEHFGTQYQNLDIVYSLEPSPLGTGGAIKKAIDQISDTSEQLLLVINGDTLIEYDLSDMCAQFNDYDADLVMALKRIEDTSRYGRVNTCKNRITSFEEKKRGNSGLINAGVYLFNACLRDELPIQPSFSFEKDFLENLIQKCNVVPSISDGYFIDIGIPEDYYKAQDELRSTSL